VVVLDLMLPDLGGLAVLHRLRAASPQLPVLLLTARDAVEDRIAGFRPGRTEFLVNLPLADSQAFHSRAIDAT
jgi:two-component system, OmpR family, response regulator